MDKQKGTEGKRYSGIEYNNLRKEENEMRKTLILILTVFLAVVLTYGFANAITGQCSNCHTMHNSQDGRGEVSTYAGGVITEHVATPQNYLLKASCIACHAGDTGETNTFGAPIVLHTTNPTNQGGGSTLAGGDFYWVATGLGGTDSMGHNVSGVALEDQVIGAGSPGYTPPGWDLNATSGFAFGQVAGGEATWSSQLTCDGIYGCHGQHSSSGITGAHHGNTGLTSNQCNVADTVGNSYRFLGGIKGLENADWNWSETAALHNEYYGVNSPANRDLSNTNYPDTSTISFSCAECHGYFHSRIDSSTAGTSPWVRHPTDINLPNSGEYASYNPDNANVYSVEAPVARPTVPATSSATVTPGTNAIVMCLSCHRAHGSPQDDILRWDYSTMVAATGTDDTGCFTCHTSKNAD
jgi:predicted CXXCH cytochrome family protein